MSVSIMYEGPIIQILLFTKPQDLQYVCCASKRINKYSCTHVFMSKYLSKWHDETSIRSNVTHWLNKENGRAMNKWLELLCKMDLYFLPNLDSSEYVCKRFYDLIGSTCSSPSLIKYISTWIDFRSTQAIEAGVTSENTAFLLQVLDMDCAQLDDVVYLACELNKYKLVDSFLKSKPEYKMDLSFALADACANEYVELSNILIKDPRCDPTVRSCACLHNALMFGNATLVRMLLRHERLTDKIGLELLQRANEFLEEQPPEAKRQAVEPWTHLRHFHQEKEYTYLTNRSYE